MYNMSLGYNFFPRDNTLYYIFLNDSQLQFTSVEKKKEKLHSADILGKERKEITKQNYNDIVSVEFLILLLLNKYK